MTSLKTLILTEICISLDTEGFYGKIKGQSIIKKTKDGLRAIHFSFSDYGEQNYVSVSIGIRFDQIEDLVKFIPPYVKNKQIITYTLGADIGDLENFKTSQWDISTESKFRSNLAEIIAKIKKYGFEYFEKYSSIESAAEYFFTEDKYSRHVCLFPHERASRAVAFAYLTRGMEFAKEIFQRKLAFLNANGSHPNDIRRFIEIVETNIFTKLTDSLGSG